ncbi:MAG: thermonuclease family protein [Pirellulales bacterium]
MSSPDDRRTSPSRSPGGKFAPPSTARWLILVVVAAFAAYQAWERYKADRDANVPVDVPTAQRPVLDPAPPPRTTPTRRNTPSSEDEHEPPPVKRGSPNAGETAPAPAKSKLNNSKDGTYAVTHIADGDTINLEGKHRVRLIGINCPEIAHPEKTPPTKAQPWSDDALRFTVAATRGKSVRIEFDPDYEETDHYGRWLCWVYYRDGGIEKLLNEELVRQGLAFVYDDRRRFPYSESIYRRLKAAQTEARRNRRGIYADE